MGYEIRLKVWTKRHDELVCCCFLKVATNRPTWNDLFPWEDSIMLGPAKIKPFNGEKILSTAISIIQLKTHLTASY